MEEGDPRSESPKGPRVQWVIYSCDTHSSATLTHLPTPRTCLSNPLLDTHHRADARLLGHRYPHMTFPCQWMSNYRGHPRGGAGFSGTSCCSYKTMTLGTTNLEMTVIYTVHYWPKYYDVTTRDRRYIYFSGLAFFSLVKSLLLREVVDNYCKFALLLCHSQSWIHTY